MLTLLKNLLYTMLCAVPVILLTVWGEKAVRRKTGQPQRGRQSGLRRVTTVAMLSAVSFILMLFDFPLPFLPSFYKIDLSELPVLIGGFALGPTAGILIEFIKLLLHLAVRGSDTAGVGEMANFLIGMAFVLPASFIYLFKKTRKRAVIGMCCGIVCMTAAGCLLNAYLLLPMYASAFGMPLDSIVALGTAVNSSITSLNTFVILAVAPFNLIKGVVVSVITELVYKRLSRTINNG